jgi:hypothetical protein
MRKVDEEEQLAVIITSSAGFETQSRNKGFDFWRASRDLDCGSSPK